MSFGFLLPRYERNSRMGIVAPWLNDKPSGNIACDSPLNNYIYIYIKIFKYVMVGNNMWYSFSDETYFAARNVAADDVDIAGTKKGPITFTGQITSSANLPYDTLTGVFTAPITGVYWFSATLNADVTSYLQCYIVRNFHDYLVELYTAAVDENSSVSGSVIIDLAKGDTVEVTKCNGEATINTYKSSFSGFLVNKTP